MRAPSGQTISFDIASSTAMLIDSSGRLLLGTATEGASNADNLTIADSGHAGITIRSGTSSNASVFFSDATSGAGEYEGVIEYQHSSNNMVFFTSGTEALRIDSNGNIGINENSPSNFDSGARDLVVGNSGNAGILIKGGTSSYSNLYFGDGIGAASYRGFIAYNHSGDSLRFGAAGQERMRIDSSGNFGIGVTPNVKLQVKLDTDKHLYFQGNIGEIGNVPGIQGVTDAGALAGLGLRGSDLRFATGSAERMRIDSSGRMGLGTGSSIDELLHIETSSSTARLKVFVSLTRQHRLSGCVSTALERRPSAAS